MPCIPEYCLQLFPNRNFRFRRSCPGRRMDHYIKLFKYRTAGVREYWLVDPEKNRILVYDFEAENTGDHSFADAVKVGIFDDLYINFSAIADLLSI